MRRNLQRTWRLIVFALIVASSFLASWAATLTVTNLADTGPGSLRATIAAANPGDVITFVVAGTITNRTGELLITQDLTINGPASGSLMISGNNASRVCEIAAGANVNISGLTLAYGHASDGAAGTNSTTPGWPGSDGGGIYNSGNLSITNCKIELCRSGEGGAGFSAPSLFPGGHGSSDGGIGGNGAGIYNAGNLTLMSCAVSYNTNGDGGSGGGTRQSDYPGGNGAGGGNGGAIYDGGNATFIACTFGYNHAGTGGAGGYGGNGAGNQTSGSNGGQGGDGGSGGGIYSQGNPVFTLCTVANNFAGNAASGGAGGTGSAGILRTSGAGTGGNGGNGGNGGSGGGLYTYGFQSIACTFVDNVCGNGGNGGQGGRGGSDLAAAGGQGGYGGTGGNGGSGGAVNALGGPPALQNCLIAQDSLGAGGLAGAAGAGGMGTPIGPPGFPGSAGNAGSGTDLFGNYSSNGHNLLGLDDAYSGLMNGVLGDIVGTGPPLNPQIGALANHGGPTPTCALLAGSPALEAGDDSLLAAPLSLATDQRGFLRLSAAHVDIGAFEVQWAALPVRASTAAENAAIHLILTNVPGASLTLLTSPDTSLPLPAWTVLGSIPETTPGLFQFIDPALTSLTQRFYRIRCP